MVFVVAEETSLLFLAVAAAAVDAADEGEEKSVDWSENCMNEKMF